MNLLLDTHIWLWSHREPERLGKRVAAELQAESNQLWLSPISVWEAMMLANSGRLNVKVPRAAWIQQLLAASRVQQAELTFDVAVESQCLATPHRDPADRFLLATARVFGLTLVTADERLIRCGEVEVLPNSA